MLQSQLKQLQLEQVNRTVSGMRKQIPTFIFGYDAKNLTMQQVYEISLAAFNELCLLYPGLKKYYSMLFSQDSIRYDRDVHSPHDNQELDKHILAYLGKIMQFFSYPACIKSMEFLVRRFRIDLYLKHELVLIFLPFHEIQSYRYILDCLNFDALDPKAFPCSREQLTQFWLMKGQHYLGQLLSTALQLKGQSFEIYAKFAVTILLELQGRAGTAEFKRKCFEFASQLMNSYLSASIVGYVAGLIVTLSNEKLQDQFANELLYKIAKQENLQPKHKMLLFYRIRRFSQIDVHSDIALSYLDVLKSVYPQLLRIEEYDELAEYLVGSVLGAGSTCVDAGLVVVHAFVVELREHETKFLRFLVISTKFLLSNRTELARKTLFEIEKLDLQSFNVGISQFIEQGGAYTEIGYFAPDNQLMILQYSIDGQRITIISALSNADYNIRYQALEAVERLISNSENSKYCASICKYLLCSIQEETDFNIYAKYLELICKLAKTTDLTDLASNQEIVDSLYKTLRRLLQTPFSNKQNEMFYMLAGLLRSKDRPLFARIVTYLDLYDLYINSFDVERFLAFVQDNIVVDVYYPFDTEEEFLACVCQNFSDTNVLAGVYLAFLSRFELSPFIIEQVLNSYKLKLLLLRKLHTISSVAQVRQIVYMLRGELLLSYLVAVYYRRSVQQLLELINATFCVKQISVYDDFVDYFEQNLKKDEAVYMVYFIHLLTIYCQSYSAERLFYKLPKTLRCLAENDFADLASELQNNFQMVNLCDSELVIRAYFYILFSKMKLSQSVEQIGALLVEIFQMLIADTTSCQMKDAAVEHLVAYIGYYSFCQNIGIDDMAYYTLCAFSDQLLQTQSVSYSAKSYLVLALSVLNAMNLTEFKEIPLILWIIFDIKLFDENVQSNSVMAALAADKAVLTAVRSYFTRIPLSLRLCDAVIYSHPQCLLEVLADHDGPVERVQSIVDFIMDALQEPEIDALTQNSCVKLLIKYQSYPGVVLVPAQIRTVFNIISAHEIVDDPINKLLTFAPFFDFEIFSAFISFAVEFTAFDAQFLKMILGLLFERFEHQELASLIVLTTKTILASSIRTPRAQLELVYALYQNVPEVISIALFTLIGSTANILLYLQEMPAIFGSSALFGSLSVALGYVFDVPLIIDILLEDNGQYVPKLLLDEVLPDSEQFIARLVDAVEALLKCLDDSCDVSECSGSLQASPLEFLLTILITIYEPLDSVYHYLCRFIGAPFIIAKVFKDIGEVSDAEHIYAKTFDILSDTITKCDDIGAFYDVFMDFKDFIVQHFSMPYVLRFYVYLLEKSQGNENNTKMMEICQLFVQLALGNFQNFTDDVELDSCLYGLTFCPIVLQTKLLQYSQQILGHLQRFAANDKLKQVVIDYLEQAIQYTIKYTAFLLPDYFEVLIHYPPRKITPTTMVYGEFEFDEEQNQEQFQHDQELLEQVMRILYVIQLNLPARIINPFIITYVQRYCTVTEIEKIVQFNFLIVHLLQLSAQSPNNVPQLFMLFSKYSEIAKGSCFYNLLLSAFCSVFPRFTISFTNQDMESFLSECLNLAFSSPGGVGLFEQAQGGVNKADYYALSCVLLLLTSIATGKQAQFYNFTIEHLADILSNVYHACCQKSDALGKTQVGTEEAALAFKTPFYIVLTEFRMPATHLAYFFFRFCGEFFHSAPFVIENFMAAKIHKTALFLLSYETDSQVRNAATEFYNKLSLLQQKQLNFEVTAAEIAKDLVEAGYLPYLTAFARNCVGNHEMVRGIVDQVVELRQSGTDKEAVQELISVLEFAAKKPLQEFM